MIISLLMWSSFDASRKFLTKDHGALFLSIALTLSQAPLFAIWAFLDDGMWPGISYLTSGTLGILFNAGASLLFLRALALSPLSKSIPMLSFAPLFASVFSFLTIGEVPSVTAITGMFCIILGSFFLNANLAELRKPWALWRSLMREPGCLLMLLVAGLWGSTSLIDKISLAYTSVPKHAFIQIIGVFVLLGLIAYKKNGLQLFRDFPGVAGRQAYWLSMIFAAAALTFQLEAIQLMQVGVFEAFKRATGIVLAAVLGYFLFGEDMKKLQILGLAIMAFGSGLAILFS